MAATDEQDMREELARSTDPELVRQRELVEKGEAQPEPQIVREELLIDRPVEVTLGDPVEVPVTFSLGELLQKQSDQEQLLLVIRQRSLTDNRISVLIELGQAGRFEEPVPDVTERLTAREDAAADQEQSSSQVLLREIFFFDHVDDDDDHHHHSAGALVRSEEVLGHYRIPVEEEVRRIAERDLGELTLRISVLPLDHQDTAVFAIGGVSLAVVTHSG